MSRFAARLKYKMRGRVEEGVLLCFFLGLLAGTAAANLYFPSFGGAAGHYLNLLKQNAELSGQERAPLFAEVLRQRFLEVFFAWLVGMTGYGLACFCLASGALGLSTGLVLSALTGEKGLMGLPVFLMTITPQIFFYLPIWAVLLFWMKRKKRRFRLLALFLLFALAALGSVCEVWVNPLLLSFML